MPGKRIQLDDETYQALDMLAHDQMKSFHELADEAFRDLLKKHGRPIELRQALRHSARQGSADAHDLEGAGPGDAGRKPSDGETNERYRNWLSTRSPSSRQCEMPLGHDEHQRAGLRPCVGHHRVADLRAYFAHVHCCCAQLAWHPGSPRWPVVSCSG
jgi:predicted transcriptional regulator